MRARQTTDRTRKDEGRNALVFCLTAWLSLALTGCFSQKRMVLDKTVLKINKTEVSTQEFSERLAQKLKHYDALYAKDEANLERTKSDTVQSFVLEVITRDFAATNHISVSAQELDTKVQEIRAKYPDDIAFRRALAEENLSVDKWRKDMEFTLLQKKVLDKISEKLSPATDAEVKEYYDANKTLFQTPARIRLRQIVLEKEDDAKRIMDELSNGADMVKLARSFSVAPEGEKGGDTGWIEKGTLDVFDQAFKMNIGARSKIVKSPYGYHIYEVLKKEPEARLSFQEAAAKIRSLLMERKQQAAFTAWLEQQVRAATVQRNDAILRAIKVTTRGS